MAATEALCADGVHDFGAASAYLKQRLALAATALSANTRTLASAYPDATVNFERVRRVSSAPLWSYTGHAGRTLVLLVPLWSFMSYE